MSDDGYMPEEGKTYKLLDPGFKKVFVFGHVLGPWPFNDGYIIADSWEDAYEELCEYAIKNDGPCDHGNDPEFKELFEVAHASHLAGKVDMDAYEKVWAWVDEHCDCESTDSGYVWMVDSWWHRETDIKPLDLVRALRKSATDEAEQERLDTLIDWYEED